MRINSHNTNRPLLFSAFLVTPWRHAKSASLIHYPLFCIYEKVCSYRVRALTEHIFNIRTEAHKTLTHLSYVCEYVCAVGVSVWVTHAIYKVAADKIRGRALDVEYI